MPRVVVSRELGVDVDTVWARVRDFESYPDSMRSVERVVELEPRNGRRITSWQARLKGSILRWTDETIEDRPNGRLEFFQVDGDLDRFDGAWQLEAQGPASTLVTLTVDFEIGIPQLRSMLDAAAAAAIRENSEHMLVDLERSVALSS